MDNRRWQANAAASPPTVPVSPSIGYPTNGGVSVTPTTPGDWWYHQIGEELRSVITAAGLTPTHNLVNQLLAALSAGWGMSKNIASTGHITLPGGLILNFGQVTVVTTATQAVTFSLAFPTACRHVVVGGESGVGTTATVAFNYSVTGCTIAQQQNPVPTGTQICHYLAIGN